MGNKKTRSCLTHDLPMTKLFLPTANAWPSKSVGVTAVNNDDLYTTHKTALYIWTTFQNAAEMHYDLHR